MSVGPSPDRVLTHHSSTSTGCEILGRRIRRWMSRRAVCRHQVTVDTVSRTSAFGSMVHECNNQAPAYRQNTCAEDPSPWYTLLCNGCGVPLTWTRVPQYSHRTTSMMALIRPASSRDRTVPDLRAASSTSVPARTTDQTSDRRREPTSRYPTRSTATVLLPTQTLGGT
jgi:hypothetical protein